jgi:hypothetical protein
VGGIIRWSCSRKFDRAIGDLEKSYEAAEETKDGKI